MLNLLKWLNSMQHVFIGAKHFAGLFSNAKVSKTVFAIKELGAGGELRRAAAKSL